MANKSTEKSTSKADDAEVTNCVSHIIQAFTNGLNVFKKVRERRKKRKAKKETQSVDPAVSDELQLSKSLRRGPQELAERYDECFAHSGHRFAKGDAIAHASLAETLIKLNTGLVTIIASFLNHNEKSGKGHLNLDYKSLTHLSDTSRKEALQSMTQLYQRLSQSQLQIHTMRLPCHKCGSLKHTDCTVKSSTTSTSSSSKKKQSSTRRATGPVITRMPIKSSKNPQLVVMRPKASSRKNSTSSNSSSSSSSKSGSPSTSTYTSPLVSPLPLYIAESPFEVEFDNHGTITGVLGGPPSQPLSGHGRRRRADSFNVSDYRPDTWPQHHQHPAYATFPADQLNLPPPKLPTFTAATPRKSSRHHSKPTSLPTAPVPPSPSPSNAPPAYQPPSGPLPPGWLDAKVAASPPPSALHPIKRRMDKPTPSSYTFASNSTQLGEIPQRKWTVPWDNEEADRLNAQAAMAAEVAALARLHAGVGGEERKKGLFRRMMKKER